MSYHLSSENAKFLFRLASEFGSGYVTERFSRTQYCIAAISNTPYTSGFNMGCKALASVSNYNVKLSVKCIAQESEVSGYVFEQLQTSLQDGYITKSLLSCQNYRYFSTPCNSKLPTALRHLKVCIPQALMIMLRKFLTHT